MPSEWDERGFERVRRADRVVVPWGVNRRGRIGTGALYTAAVNAAAREIVR